MKRLLLSALLLLGFVAAPLAQDMTSTPDWPAVIQKVEQSIYRITMEAETQFGTVHGSCTGWSISEKNGYVVTAAHCEGDNIQADGQDAEVRYVNPQADLMVLKIKDGKPALAASGTEVTRGMELGAIGYGYGFMTPMAKVCHVATPDQVINELGPGERFLLADCNYVSGMSGGPVVDRAGKIISIVQMGDGGQGVGFGRVLAELRAIVGYFGR
jgi:S1-C subfamily serine protease